jgi:hypothetical protein
MNTLVNWGVGWWRRSLHPIGHTVKSGESHDLIASLLDSELAIRSGANVYLEMQPSEAAKPE